MKKGLFVSATSTEIGKTIVSSMICLKLAQNSYKTAYYKPVQSGMIVDESGNKISGDCRFVKTVLKEFPGFNTFTSYMLTKPASPHFSARLENVLIDLKKIKNDFKNITATNDFVITEGAGGLFVPLDEKGRMMIDIPFKLNINTILIGYAGLGTINHVGLSYSYAHSKKVRISAVILISYENTPTDIELENVRILKKLLKNDNIFIIPAVKDADTEKNMIGDLLYKLEYFPDVNKILEWINE